MESCKLPDVPLFRGLTETGGRRGHRGPADAPPPLAKGEVLLRWLHRAAIGCGTGGPRAYGASGRLGQQNAVGSCRAGRSVCRDLRLPARGTAAGQRGGSRKRRGAAFGHRSTIAVRLRTVALEDDPKPAAYCCPQKPGAGPAQPVHGSQDDTRAHHGVFFRCWRGAAAVCSSTCPLTVSSWPTTWALTAAP